MLGHQALLYRDASGYRGQVGALVAEALRLGRVVLVAVPDRQRGWLSHLRAEGPADLEWADLTQVGRNPNRIIPALRSFLTHHDGRPVTVIEEPMWVGRTAAAIAELARHEALVNTAFAADAATFVCPYDTSRLGSNVLAVAARTHRVLRGRSGSRVSGAYTDPQTLWHSMGELPPAPAHAATAGFDMHTLAAARHMVPEAAAAAGLSAGRSDDLVLAVSEVAGNSVSHAGGSGTLRTWSEPSSVVCEVADPALITDPLVGRRRPATGAEHGRGLWLANQLVDLLQIDSTSRRTLVRLRVEL